MSRKKERVVKPVTPPSRPEPDWKQVCIECPAVCCTDLAIPISKPKTQDEVDELKWQLQYDTVHVAIRDRRWFVVVKGTCIYLGDDKLCTIYDGRPPRCRKHKPPNCERFGSWYDALITTPEELDRHLNAERGTISLA